MDYVTYKGLRRIISSRETLSISLSTVSGVLVRDQHPACPPSSRVVQLDQEPLAWILRPSALPGYRA